MTVSVLIACVNGLPMIKECLSALAGQPAEVIVADVTGAETNRLIQKKFPEVRLISVAQRLTIPQLRTMALAESTGEIVAVIEDHCNVAPNWCAEIVNAHRAHPECVAVGGVVENGSCERLVDWAVFFCEYSRYMLPRVPGMNEDIPGNNVSYKRRAFEGIEGLEQALTAGFWESTLHGKLLERGERFLLEPAIVVYHKKRFGFGYFVGQRYQYSRYYAGTRWGGAGLATRLARALLSLALPPLLMARIVAQVLPKRRHRKELLLCVPLLAIFTWVWAFGEAVGCLFGPGQSLSRVE